MPVASTIDPDFKKKRKIQLSSLKRIPLTKENWEKYTKDTQLEVGNTLYFHRPGITGVLWLKNDQLVCLLVMTTDKDNVTWISRLEVVKEYRSHGLSRQLLDVGVREFHATHIGVLKKNAVAKQLYENYGFETFQKLKDGYLMKLKHTSNKGVTESFLTTIYS